MTNTVHFLCEILDKLDLTSSEISCGEKKAENLSLCRSADGAQAKIEYSDGSTLLIQHNISSSKSSGKSILQNTKTIDVKLQQPIVVMEERRSEIRKGLQDGRSRELDKFETILYAVASGLIIMLLGIGNFCYSNGISIWLFKWLFWLALILLAISIGFLMFSDYSAQRSRKITMDMMDEQDSDEERGGFGAKEKSKTADGKPNAQAREGDRWNKWTKISNIVARRTLVVGVSSSFIALIWLTATIPNEKSQTTES